MNRTKRPRATSRRTTQRRPASRRTRRQRPASSALRQVKQNVLFSGVAAKRLSRITPKLTTHRYAPGELIFDEFTKGRSLYLISTGRVQIKKYTKYGIESLLAVLHAGDFFGELSILDGLPRSARAEAMEECTIFELPAADCRDLITHSDAFTFNLLKNIALRLRSIDQTFVHEIERNALSSKLEMDKLNMLVQASKTVNSTLDITKLLRLILQTATRATRADRGTVYLLDEANREIWSEVAQGDDMIQIRLPIGKGIAGYVAKTGQIVNITDAYKDSRFDPEIDRMSGYRTRTVLCMVMRNKEGKIVGVIQLLNKAEGPFTQEDESFIDALSVHAAIAVENARIAREMVRSERLSAVGRMASSIIHDIKNPMAALHTYAQILKRKSETDESAEIADEIIQQIDRFVKMTQEVLDFSRGISEIHFTTAALGEVVQQALRQITPELEKSRVTLVTHLDYTGTCTLDVEKMLRVIYNIARNALDAMPEGGSLTVATRSQDGIAVVEISDTGSGIPEHIKGRIFEPFFTYGKKHGTGLGLAIVKRIVEDHHGQIEVQSSPRTGTTVRLILPLSPPTERSVPDRI
jgi:signal transduction histidine kinase